MDTGSNAYRDRWFIDVKGNITGPMTTADIIRDLMDGKTSVTQRISFDGKEWAAICNTPHFETALKDLFQALSSQTIQDGNESPLLQNSQVSEVSTIRSLENITEGISEQLSHARHLEEMVATTQKLNSVLKEITLKKKTIRQEKEGEEDEIHPDDEDVFLSLPKKFPSLASIFKGRSTRRQRLVYGFLLVLALMGGGIELWRASEERAAQELAAKKLAEAKLARISGDYNKAISSFQSIKDGKTLESLSTAELLDMADAHAQGKDFQHSDELINQVLTRSTSPTDIARAHAMSGIIAMQTKNLDGAAIAYEKSIQTKPLYPTLHNLAVIRLKQKKYGEAESLFLKALALPETEGSNSREATLFGLLEVAAELDRAEREKVPETKENRRLSVVRGLFAQAAAAPTNRSVEFKLAQSFIELEDGKADAFQVHALEFIDASRTSAESRTSSSERKLSLESSVDESTTAWTNLYRLCMSVYNKDRGNDLHAAFYGSCLARTHGAEAALPYVRYAHSKRPDDPIYAGLLGTLLFESKKIEEAQRILVTNIDRLEASSKLGWKTLSRICEDQAKTDNLTAECQAVRMPASDRTENITNAPGVIPTTVQPPSATH